MGTNEALIPYDETQEPGNEPGNARPDIVANIGYSFSLTGQGVFPHEMLAKKACWPGDRTSGELAYSAMSGPKVINIISAYYPQVGRWALSGWRVSNIYEYNHYNDNDNYYHTWPA
jgi:hypothetical protein